MTTSKIRKVFIASPPDLGVERQAFLKVIELLNLGHADDTMVRLLPTGWQDPLAPTHPQAESLTNEEIDSSDVFILVLHRQWGQKVAGSKYDSYTEEQFCQARECYHKTGHPAIFVYFKGVAAASLANPGSQLQKIIDFKLELEEADSILFKQYDTENEFAQMLENHLKAYLTGKIRPENINDFRTTLSLEARKEITEALKSLAEAEQRMDMLVAQGNRFVGQVAAAEKSAIELSNSAAAYALAGKLEHARIGFAQAFQSSNLPEVLSMAATFYLGVEELNEADKLLHRMLTQFPEFDASALARKLGVRLHSRGDLDHAETMIRASLEIEEKLGRPEGVAIDYRNLGVIFNARGDFSQAEALFRKSLAVEKNPAPR